MKQQYHVQADKRVSLAVTDPRGKHANLESSTFRIEPQRFLSTATPHGGSYLWSLAVMQAAVPLRRSRHGSEGRLGMLGNNSGISLVRPRAPAQPQRAASKVCWYDTGDTGVQSFNISGRI